MFGTNEIVGQKFFKNAPERSLFVTSMFFTLQGEGPYNGMPALFIRLTKCNLACSFCFVPCTEITMGDRTKKRIDQVQIGDIVLSYNEDTKEYQPKKVSHVYQSSPKRLIRVRTNHGRVHCTPEHPFLVNGKWVIASELKMGDAITGFNIQYEEHNRFVEEVYELSETELVNYNTSSDDFIVYNLEVEDNHTYIANSCVVHNCDTFFDDGDWMTFEQIEEKSEETIKAYFGGEMPEWIRGRDGIWNIVLVITGGEPTLQKNLTSFLDWQVPVYKAVQIESNGTVNLEIPDGVTLVCSPKCAEKEGKATKYLAPTKQILERADCLKFVMSADKDSPYNEVPQWAHEWKNRSGGEIFVSPMNVYNTFPQKIKLLRSEKGQITMEERSTVDEVISFWEPGLLDLAANQANHEYVARYCMSHGFRLNLQMHLYASLA